MFLKSIKLKNFRCFSDLELSFSDAESSDRAEEIRKTTILLGATVTLVPAACRPCSAPMPP